MINFLYRNASMFAYLCLFCIIFYFLTDLHNFHLFDPYHYDGDTLETYAEYGRAYIFNDFSTRSYAPFEPTDPNSWVYAINLFFQIDANLKIICYWLTGDTIASVNLYFLLTFALAFLTSNYVLGKLRLRNPYKFATSTLYALMPYHFMRALSHSYESSYFLTPLLILILLWIWSARPLFSVWKKDQWTFSLRDKRALFTLIVVVFFSSFHLYHQFFFAVLAVSSALMAAAYRRSLPHLLSGAFVGCLAAGVLLFKKMLIHFATAASLKLAFGGAPIASYGDSEKYPLKIIQILLPLPQHRWAGLGSIRQLYDSAHPLVNENSSVTLGLAGAIGFLLILAVAVAPGRQRISITAKFGLLTVVALLFASMGGFSSALSTFSYHLFGPNFELSQTRGWNRIIIFIGFFSYYAFFIIIKNGVRWAHNRCFYMLPQNSLDFPVVMLVFGLALWDQVPFKLTTPSTAIDAYRSDRDFFSSIERRLPTDSSIFQMPLMISRASGYINGVYATNGLRPYIASEKLKFMYGGDALSKQVQWWQSVIALPPKIQLVKFCKYGFSGVLIHRSMYVDPIAVEKNFADILQASPQTSTLLDFSFFQITDYCKNNYILPTDLVSERKNLLLSMSAPDSATNFFSADMFYRQVGRPFLDSENELVIASEKGEQGYVAYGPYVNLASGKYLAEFHVNIDGPASSDSVVLDVAESSPNEAAHQIAARTLGGTDGRHGPVTLEFDVTSNSNKYEFRVLTKGMESIEFSGVGIKRQALPQQK